MFKLTVLKCEDPPFGGENDDVHESKCGCQWRDLG